MKKRFAKIIATFMVMISVLFVAAPANAYSVGPGLDWGSGQTFLYINFSSAGGTNVSLDSINVSTNGCNSTEADGAYRSINVIYRSDNTGAFLAQKQYSLKGCYFSMPNWAVSNGPGEVTAQMVVRKNNAPDRTLYWRIRIHADGAAYVEDKYTTTAGDCC